MEKNIKWSDFETASWGIPGLQEGHWICKIRDVNVSIVKWMKCMHDGNYEIFSNEELFFDVERYKTKDQVLARLNELKENHVNKEIIICDAPGCNEQVQKGITCSGCIAELEYDRHWEKKEKEFISKLTFNNASDECDVCAEECCEEFFTHSNGKKYVKRDCELGEGQFGFQELCNV